MVSSTAATLAEASAYSVFLLGAFRFLPTLLRRPPKACLGAPMEDQLGLDKKTKTKKRDGGATRRGLPGGTSVADLPYSTGGALQLILQKVCSVQTPPVTKTLTRGTLVKRPKYTDLHTVAFPLRKNSIALMVLTRATSGPVVVDGESFLDALFASAGQG